MAVQVDPMSLEYSILTVVTPLLVQVMVCAVPPDHTSPPTGAVNRTVAAACMVNTAFDWSVTLALAVSVIRTRQFVDEETFGTVHEYELADAAVLAIICVHDEPPLVEYSILIFVTFELVQVMVRDEPVVHVSPPLGDMTATVPGWTMVKTAFEWSVTVALAVSVIFTRLFVDDTFGTVQEYELADAGVLAIIVVQLVPLSVVYSNLTLVTPEDVQVMARDEEAVQDSEPLGEARVKEPDKTNFATFESVPPRMNSPEGFFNISIIRILANVENIMVLKEEFIIDNTPLPLAFVGYNASGVTG